MREERQLTARIVMVVSLTLATLAVVQGYRIHTSGKAATSHTVTTIVADSTTTSSTTTTTPTDPVIMAAGDIACPASLLQVPPKGECRMARTADLISAAKPNAILTLGDNQYDGGSLADFNASYQPTWGLFKGITHPAIGNHEYGTKAASGYFDYFGAAAGPRGRGYYSFDLGSWHLITLNSNCTIVSCKAGSEQEQWLRDDLKRDAAKCVLVYFHHPRFSSGAEHGDDPLVAPLWQAMYDGGVDVVLNGHEHNYERFAQLDPNGNPDQSRGIREFVVGTGGRNLYAFRSAVPPTSQARYAGGYGVIKMTLHPDSYDWQFVGEPGTSFSDVGTTTCH